MAELPFKSTKFRVARAMRSGYIGTTPTNLGTHTLYNNSTGANMLVIRDISVGCATAGDLIVGGITQTILGAVAGLAVPLVAGMSSLAGLHYYADTATAISVDWFAGAGELTGRFPHDFPLAILQPGWGFAVQDKTAAHQMMCSFIWEMLDPADVYFRELMDQP